MSYDDDDDYDYDDDERRGPGKLLGLAAILVGVAVLAWFVVVPSFQEDSVTSTQTPAAVTTTAGSPSTTSSAGAETDATATTDEADESTDEEGTDESGTVAEGASSATTAAFPPATSDEPASTNPQPAGEVATYPTLPDGSPVPVLAVFDTETITLSGVVQSEEAATRLDGLAIANSKFPEAEVVSTLTFDPTVPLSVGIRVVEMNSVRFPESTADLLPEHRAEIDRAAQVLSLFSNVSVLVIGHADQRGSAETNFAISEERARVVATYLVSTGIDPSRVSSRAVGDLDLLALDNDARSFALNRRTEFVFYGLLNDPE
jgi:outer membrane protein OmpA-like peptidoglycan-associated protein